MKTFFEWVAEKHPDFFEGRDPREPGTPEWEKAKQIAHKRMVGATSKAYAKGRQRRGGIDPIAKDIAYHGPGAKV